MATHPLSHLIIAALEESVEKLKAELKVLEPSMHQQKSGMFITHDGESEITVYASLQYKAYVPKKYDGWKVTFLEWNGDDLVIDLDIMIDVQI